MAELSREEKEILEGLKEGRNKVIENGKITRIDVKKKYLLGKGGIKKVYYKIKEYRR